MVIGGMGLITGDIAPDIEIAFANKLPAFALRPTQIIDTRLELSMIIYCNL